MNSKSRLWLEFGLMYILAPLSLYFSEGRFVIAGICVWSILGAFLLSRTEGFYWRNLMNWPVRKDWTRVFFMAFMVLLISVVATNTIFPERLFALPAQYFSFWVLLMVLYPIFSAFPQEIIFRALYFERYGQILPQRGKMLLNAIIFMYAHIAYGYPIVLVMTFLGGLIFARAYLREEFPLAVILHSVAGNMIFTSGLGWLFCASCS